MKIIQWQEKREEEGRKKVGIGRNTKNKGNHIEKEQVQGIRQEGLDIFFAEPTTPTPAPYEYFGTLMTD